MNCDPRVVSLKGIQVIDGDVEDGNHLRAFVGTEHGFARDDLKLSGENSVPNVLHRQRRIP